MVATLKPYRVGLVGLIVGASMLFSSSNAFAEQALTTVICADPAGVQQEFQIGWDNSNPFFEGKGDIPRLFCEGGFAQPYTIYISDTLPADSPLRYYAGIVPTPTPSPTQTTTIDPTPTPLPLPSQTPIPVEPTPVVSVPSLAPVEPPAPPMEPSPTQTLETAPTPQPEPPTPAPEPPVEASPPPLVEPSPPALAPEPPPAPPIVIELPPLLADLPGALQLVAAAEAIMNIGNDMTPEQRKESQQVAVAAVLVTQIASNIRKVK
jgi:hypothetical protein